MSRYPYSSADRAVNDFTTYLVKEYGAEALKRNLIPKRKKEHLEKLKRCRDKGNKR